MMRPLRIIFGPGNRRLVWVGAFVVLVVIVLASGFFLRPMVIVGRAPPPVSPPPPNADSLEPGSESVYPEHGIDSEQIIIARRTKLEALPKGNITLRAPRTMKIGDKRKVEAEVGFKVPIKRPTSPASTTVEDTLHVSSEMIATLDSPAFEIKAITPEQQPIVEGYPTVWAWNVEANESGEQVLTATVYALVGDKSDRIRIASYEHKISVSVREQTWGEWLESVGKEIGTVQAILMALGAVATPILAWFGISLGRRRNKATSSPSSATSPELSPPAT